jgi:hypothetical protein
VRVIVVPIQRQAHGMGMSAHRQANLQHVAFGLERGQLGALLVRQKRKASFEALFLER